MDEQERSGLSASPPGGRAHLDGLVPVVYEELKALACKLLQEKSDGVTLAPTSLVHEAYLRLLDQRRTDWQDRIHFLYIAARTMRRVLVDHFRARVAEKRGGGAMPVPLDEVDAAVAPREADVLAVDHLLAELEALDPQQGRIVELRFFAGMNVEETAEALGISTATVKRDWAVARAWMARRLLAAPGGHGPS